MDSSEDPIISVIVCTYNRAQMLKDTLACLLAQECGDSAIEIIVIDNGSNDGTADLVAAMGGALNRPIRYFLEQRRGLSFCRNHGIRMARGKYLAFTDDDCRPERNWLREIITLFATAQADSVVGRVLLPAEIPVPGWIGRNPDVFWGPLALCEHGSGNFRVAPEAPLSFVGANMAHRKSLFGQIGEFRTDLGRGSGALGEDSEFLDRIRKSGKVIWYCGSATVWHHLDPARLGVAGILSWYSGKVREITRRSGASGLPSRLYVLGKIALSSLAKLGRVILSLLR